MNSSRPYIMRALYEWIVENDLTPYVLVEASISGVIVPQQFVKDNQIVLNISPDAVVDLNISNEAVVCNGWFGGVATDIFVPISAVVGIYARENGQGMVFDAEETVRSTDDTPPEPAEKRPSLKIVK